MGIGVVGVSSVLVFSWREGKGWMHRQLKSLFRGYCEICSVQTFPSEVNCSQRGQASPFSCTDVISCHMPYACWSVFLSNLMRAWQRRQALRTYTYQTGRVHLAGDRKGTPHRRRHSSTPILPQGPRVDFSLGNRGFSPPS